MTDRTQAPARPSWLGCWRLRSHIMHIDRKYGEHFAQEAKQEQRKAG